MEKFTDWRDKGTGIAPFFPPPTSSKEGKVLNSVVYGFFFMIKIILLLPFIIVNQLTGSKMALTTILKRLFGWSMDVNVIGVKRKAVTKKEHYPTAGNLYLVNYQSALDAITLNLLSQGNPIFLVPDNVHIYKLSLWNFIRYTLDDGSLNISKYGEIVANINELKKSVNFLFIEGTCSNGKSTLPFNLNSQTLLEFLEPDNNLSLIHI